ncbi:MAG: hypothetical protein B6D44_02060 [Ignavibacteriales bacterium UTCHB2]|jgi:hypothetical protein|nr:MAG: hypothetical protein B6D44_02060 [Ignavibacteriales bacterium UTCHB2]HQI41295.1 hypothetical protein [Ignavibacteriaceae bacterium]
MAKLKKQVLGKVSGALGDIVFREINGKNIIGMKASKVKVPVDSGSIARRAKFSLSARLSKMIALHPALKAIWQLKAPSGLSAHNFLIKANYINVLPDNLTDLVKLIPVAGFPVNSVNSTVSAQFVNVELDVIGTNNNINISIETQIEMLSIVFLYAPLDESVDNYSIIAVSSGNVALNLKETIQFNAPLIGNDELLFGKYHSNKTFSAFVTKDAAGNVINYSNTLPLST